MKSRVLKEWQDLTPAARSKVEEVSAEAVKKFAHFLIDAASGGRSTSQISPIL